MPPLLLEGLGSGDVVEKGVRQELGEAESANKRNEYNNCHAVVTEYYYFVQIV